MDKFKQLTAQVIPLDVDNVDTDMIIPAEHLKSISRSGYGEGLFSALKGLYPDFILNNPAYKNGQILLSKANFGCGSSREHAVWAILQYGIKVVVCSSFSDIFFNNSAKNGLLLISLPEAVINKWIALSLADASLSMTVNLVDCTVGFAGEEHKFSYDPYRRHCLLEGLDDLDYLLSSDKIITEYEAKRG
jgi:3-isopropylmalate/(R)-2-methylmalate dehydratase small subunit